MEKVHHGTAKYGWLYPDGRFRESAWGTHSAEAGEIIRETGCGREFYGCVCMNEGDFLCARGYCLIHNPGLGDRVAVTHTRPLTRKQREFLCNYFLKLGDVKDAEKFLEMEF